jgi:protein TonB
VAARAGGVAGRAEGAAVGHPYLERLVHQVSRSWIKPRSGLPDRAAVVRFRVGRAGAVSGVELERSSGVALYDRAALRAVELAAPLPPLPHDATSEVLTVHFEFLP